MLIIYVEKGASLKIRAKVYILWMFLKPNFIFFKQT